MSAVPVSERTFSPALPPVPRGNPKQNGYVAHIAKRLAKSGKLADMLNGGESLHDVDPATREYLINIAKAVRYALSQSEVIAAGDVSTMREESSWR